MDPRWGLTPTQRKCKCTIFFQANPAKSHHTFASLHCLESPTKIGETFNDPLDPRNCRCKQGVRYRYQRPKTDSSCHKFNGCSIFANVEVLLFLKQSARNKGRTHEIRSDYPLVNQHSNGISSFSIGNVHLQSGSIFHCYVSNVHHQP